MWKAFPYHDAITIFLQGWRWAYYICGSVGILLSFIFLFTIKEPERQGSGRNNDVEINKFPGGEVTWLNQAAVVLKSFANPSLVVVCIAGSIRNAGIAHIKIQFIHKLSPWLCFYFVVLMRSQ